MTRSEFCKFLVPVSVTRSENCKNGHFCLLRTCNVADGQTDQEIHDDYGDQNEEKHEHQLSRHCR